MATAPDPIFLDTNVLIYSRLNLSPFHAAAVGKLAALTGGGHELWISRQTLREYLAGMSRPGALTGTAPMSTLIGDIQTFAKTYRIAEDGPTVTAELLTVLNTVTVAGSQVHDANIVATMLAHGVPRILTNNVVHFNRFAAFIGVEPLVP